MQSASHILKLGLALFLFSCGSETQQPKPARFVPYPVQVKGLTSGFVDVAFGGDAACALRESGTVHCWGAANYLKPDGENVFVAEPVVVELPPIKALMSGAAMVLLPEGGQSVFHLLAGNFFEFPAPQTAFASVSNDTNLDNGYQAQCLFLLDGTLRCKSYYLRYETPLTEVETTVEQTVGLGVSLLEDGTVICSGIQQCGLPSTRNPDVPEGYGSGPTLAGAPKATHVSNGCLVSEDGQVYCWGENGWGQLGTGNTKWFDGNWKPVLHVREATKVIRNYEYACALTRKGQLWCWGANFAGQLGIGYVSTGSCPEHPPGYYPGPGDPGHETCGFGVFEPQLVLEHVSDFAISPVATCAVLTSGAVKCWGSQLRGSLGNGVVVKY